MPTKGMTEKSRKRRAKTVRRTPNPIYYDDGTGEEQDGFYETPKHPITRRGSDDSGDQGPEFSEYKRPSPPVNRRRHGDDASEQPCTVSLPSENPLAQYFTDLFLQKACRVFVADKITEIPVKYPVKAVFQTAYGQIVVFCTSTRVTFFDKIGVDRRNLRFFKKEMETERLLGIGQASFGANKGLQRDMAKEFLLLRHRMSLPDVCRYVLSRQDSEMFEYLLANHKGLQWFEKSITGSPPSENPPT